MKKQEYKVLGHKVQYNVPTDSAEFNSLDPKRPDAACEEATANIVYRSMNPETRDLFLHGREAAEAKDGKSAVSKIVGVEEEANSWGLDFGTGLTVTIDGEKVVVTNFDRGTKQVKDKSGNVRKDSSGEPVTRYNEPEEVYYNRVLSMAVALKKFASEDAAVAHFDPLIQSIASEVVFDITAPTHTDRGPKKLAAKYKAAAAKLITLGSVDNFVSTKLQPAVNKTFTATNDASKMYTGEFAGTDGKPVAFNVSDKDAEALGWLVKEYFDWKTSNELTNV